MSTNIFKIEVRRTGILDYEWYIRDTSREWFQIIAGGATYTKRGAVRAANKCFDDMQDRNEREIAVEYYRAITRNTEEDA